MIIAEEKAGEIQWEERDRVAKGKGNLGKILAVEKGGEIRGWEGGKGEPG